MVLEKFLPKKKPKKRAKLVVKFPKILFAQGETPKILRKLFTDARKKLKVVVSERSLLKFLKREMKEVVKAIEKEKVPKKMKPLKEQKKKLKALRQKRNVLRTLIKSRDARKEFLSRVVTKKITRIKKVKIKVRGYTRTFRGKKIKVRPHTRTIRKKVEIVKQYLMTG
jgi:hypothetical protein